MLWVRWGFAVLLKMDKAFDVGKTAARAFLSGVRTQALIIAVAGFAPFIGAVLWGAVLGSRRQAALGFLNKTCFPQG